MHLHFVDDEENTIVVGVADIAAAKDLFERSMEMYPWVSATLRENNGRYVTSYLRLNGAVESHPLITPEMIRDTLSIRAQVRQGELPYLDKPWIIPGLCHEVSEYLEGEYGLARTSGTIMAKDLLTPICLHFWNVLPDMTIVDMTADQLQEGSDFRIIPVGHPDWYRYQPEYECVDDLESEKGSGIYTDEMIDFILATAKRIEGQKPAGLRECLHCSPADADLMTRLHPFVLEHNASTVLENQRHLERGAKRDAAVNCFDR